MKPKILLIYIDQSAKLGIFPYLSTIFHSYLDFDCLLFDQVDPEKISDYQMILFSSELCRTLVYEKLRHLQIPMYQCRRELNYTYLHKILEIPSGASVCIVNDRKKNCEAIKNSLLSLGFSHYKYCIYYPGGPSVDADVQYAITPGEARFSPPGIKYIVDIGNRNVDIATLCHIVSVFQLPETILNQITSNFAGYIGNFMRIITAQMEKLTARSYDSNKLLDYLDFGICISETDGTVFQVNPAFCRLFCMEKSAMSGRYLTDIFREWGYFLRIEEMTDGAPILIQNEKKELIDFYFSRSYVSSFQETKYLFFAVPHQAAKPLNEPASLIQKKQPSAISEYDSSVLRMLEKSAVFSEILERVRIFSEAGLPILFLGDAGLFQLTLAHYVHASSCSSGKFIYLNAGDSSALFDPHALQMQSGETGCTVFVDNLEAASLPFHYALCSYLKNRSQNTPPPQKIVCSASETLDSLIASGQFLKELFYQLNPLTLRLPGLKTLKHEIPAFFRFYFENMVSDTGGSLEDFFSPQLLVFLQSYDYPGNFQEMENLFRYFSCIYKGKKLSLDSLPPYIRYVPGEDGAVLSFREKEVLSLIRSHPHCGRNRISVLLSESGHALTAHQIRSILTKLSDDGYIEILKTKQGCRITELGEYILSKAGFA